MRVKSFGFWEDARIHEGEVEGLADWCLRELVSIKLWGVLNEYTELTPDGISHPL